jgi:phosphoglycolate phosphatase
MKLVVSDLDGVLVDSSDLYARAVQHALEGRGLSPPMEEVIFHRVAHVETWLDALLPATVPDRDELRRELTSEVRARMVEHAGEIPIHPDARAMLSAVSQAYPLMLLTNSTAAFAGTILDRHGLLAMFERVVTADDGFSSKHDAITHLAESRGLSAREVALVGDTLRDVASGRRAGCYVIVVYSSWSWEWGELAALEAAGPDAIVRGLGEVMGALERARP